MVAEQDKTLQALQIAIRMEIDGQEFYLKASQGSSNRLGKKLLETLAAEEDSHRRKFEQIYDAIRSKQAWPVVDVRPDGGRGLRTLFATATRELGANIEVLPTELDAVQKAMGMENRSYDFYKSQEQQAGEGAEREFYQNLAAVERGHHLALLDYYEYLKDPAGWFVQKEHPSLDGG